MRIPPAYCPRCGSDDTDIRCYRSPTRHYERRCATCRHRWPVERLWEAHGPRMHGPRTEETAA